MKVRHCYMLSAGVWGQQSGCGGRGARKGASWVYVIRTGLGAAALEGLEGRGLSRQRR